MLDDNELLFDELYEKTKDCGRVQFINLLMEKERENQQLKKQLKTSEKARKEAIELVKNNQRKDEFVKLNEWQARDLISILDIDIDKGE